MSDIILDSGVFIASQLPETFTRQAVGMLQALRGTEINFHAPALMHYEIVAVCRKAVYQKRITPEEGLKVRDTLLNGAVTLHFDEALLKRGYELATKYNRPTAYDAQYLALAERLACDFWTADERLFNAVKEAFPQVHWLGNWQPSQEK